MTKEEIYQEATLKSLGNNSTGTRMDVIYLAMDEYAKQQAIEFHQWTVRCQWSPLVSSIPGPATYAPYDSDQRLSTEELYTLYLNQSL